ncbi:hypothetical protein EI94DRAFT_1697359 [Lactarius quietus]|nr:hypothetical protein EI94DRAFT_1697359 [Lactarius quietus]
MTPSPLPLLRRQLAQLELDSFHRNNDVSNNDHEDDDHESGGGGHGDTCGAMQYNITLLNKAMAIAWAGLKLATSRNYGSGLHFQKPKLVGELDDDMDAILRSVEDDTNRQRNMRQQLQRRPRLQSSPSSSSDHNIATGSAVKTPLVTSLAGNEDVHAASETKKREELIADNVRSMNIDADDVQPLGEEVNDSDMHVQGATG